MRAKKIRPIKNWPLGLPDDDYDEEDEDGEREVLVIATVSNGYTIRNLDSDKKCVADEIEKLCDLMKQLLVERKLKGKK